MTLSQQKSWEIEVVRQLLLELYCQDTFRGEERPIGDLVRKTGTNNRAEKKPTKKRKGTNRKENSP